MNDKKLENEIRIRLNRQKRPSMTKEQEEVFFTALRQEISHKTIYPRKSWFLRLAEQIPYVSPAVWLIQGAILMIGILFAMDKEMSGWVQTASILVSLVGMAGVPELAKSFSCGMWEMEESCRYNLRQLLAVRLVLLGAIDTLMLLCFLLLAGWRHTMAAEIILYLVIPFNLSNSIYLLLFRYLRGRCSLSFMAAVGLLQAAAMIGFSQIIHIFVNTATQAAGLWLIKGGGFASFLLLSVCIYQLFDTINKEGTKTWNYGQTV